ncbi:MAG: FdhF/YdeP family oxidoreductase [Acidobacteriota bacterium]
MTRCVESGMRMGFAEEIVLLVLDADTGFIRPLPAGTLECAIAGAVLFDLAFARRIDSDLRDVFVLISGPTGSPPLDRALTPLLAYGRTLAIRDALAIVAMVAPDILDELLDKLVRDGVLSRRHGWRPADWSRALDARRRIRSAILGDEVPDPRDAALVSLVDASGLMWRLFTTDELSGREERVRLLAGIEPIGRWIAEAIRSLDRPSIEETGKAILGLQHDAPVQHAGGARAVVSAMNHILVDMGIAKGMLALGKINQRDGFDCPACAWPDPDERARFELCENGAKFIGSEATTELIADDFFRRWRLEDLMFQSDYWLERQGRLSRPMVRRDGSQHYEPITYEQAFELIARELNKLSSPDEAVFYAGGRTSNEAAFIYQLFARLFGTNNLPGSANLCHEPSASGLVASLGSGKGTVSLDDIHRAGAIFIFGHNPGSNHPRMLTALQRAARAGCRIVAVNPLPEAGLLRFANPYEIRGLFGGSTQLASLFIPVRINGDMALLKGMMKRILEEEDRRPGKVLDHEFITTHTSGFPELKRALDELAWEPIEEQSGVGRELIDQAARVYMEAESVVASWCLGITQHSNATATVQEIVNLLLLRGNIGKPGAGVLPVRGHSNVQGCRTMGIGEKIPDWFLDALGREFAFTPPRAAGLNAVEAIRAMHDGRCRSFVSLGGNVAASGPDSELTIQALERCRLTVMISTKLNRSHVAAGRCGIILPCLGRTEIDVEESGQQFVTVENAMGEVHDSRGCLQPAAQGLYSEPRIIAGIAAATLGERGGVPWRQFASNYDLIRDSISRVVPGLADFNTRVRRGGILMPNPARVRQFNCAGGRARFTVHDLRADRPVPGQFLLMTIRSHDQFDTMIFGLNDRYRGILNNRRVVLMNVDDMQEHGIRPGSLVDMTCETGGRVRTMRFMHAVGYPIPRGCAATYFPEANAIVPIEVTDLPSGTPGSKSVVVAIRPSGRHIELEIGCRYD